MAKVCLIYPRDLNMHFFPIGLGYVAAYLKEQGHQVIFLDISKNDLHLLHHPQIVHCDLVGLSMTTPQLGLAKKVITILKEARKDLPIVAGGVHPSFFKGQLIQDLNIDYVIYGEGELTLNELVNALQQNKDHLSSINGLVFREGKEIITNPPREVIPDLDRLPFPARDLVNFRSYLQPPGLIRGIWTNRSTNMTTSRGCPGRCTYCGGNFIFNRKYRRRTVDNVLEEIDLLVKDYQVDGISFQDDTFLMNTQWIEEFSEKFISRQYGIKWSCFGRVDTVNEKIIKAIKKAGCVQIEYGIETGSERVLKEIKKNTNLEQIRKAIRMTKEHGIRAFGCFMFGFTDDTEEDLQKTIDLVGQLKLDFAACYYTIPFPGSELYDRAVKENRILEPDMSKWYIRVDNIWKVNLDSSTIIKYKKEFFKKVRYNNLMFFLKRPVFMLRLIFLFIRNIKATMQSIFQSIKYHSFDDFGYYFYAFQSKGMKDRNKIELD
jgi:anaerobic magnesium-protoporphyrin IX monomethyl ester cyclase